MFKYENINSIHIEPTEKCQALCPMCPRTNNPNVGKYELYIDDYKKIFEIDFIKQLRKISFCGNYGDPIFSKDLLEAVKFFRIINRNLKIQIHTNGGARNKEWWEELSFYLGEKSMMVFSVDGLEDTNHIYRKNVKWENVLSSIQFYKELKNPARMDFLIFKHNEHQINDIKIFCKENNLNLIIKKSSRFFDMNKNKFNKNKNGIEISSNYFDDIIIENKKINCKTLKNKEIFLNARGHIFPCCWTAMEYQFDKSITSQIDAKKLPLKECLESNFIKDIVKKWENNNPQICDKICGKYSFLFNNQFKDTDLEKFTY